MNDPLAATVILLVAMCLSLAGWLVLSAFLLTLRQWRAERAFRRAEEERRRAWTARLTSQT